MKRRTFLISGGLLFAGLSSLVIYWPNRWKYIVIHHSAGNYGDIEFLQRVHRERQPNDLIDAIPYHFVIGNGNGLEMGEIASDWRQKKNIWGSHVSAKNRDKNYRGIGICLIGDYELNPVPNAQYNALVSLAKELMEKYSIAAESVNGHGLISGERTQCPGKHFPMEKFLSDIQKS